ncbi:natural cytotoxicity triggering receptor 2-like isoform X2 [Saccopteryx leptura]|uniref:natural cytotoxicity triggering receptor 2-like isoform X2 n=1 Tax=Saccopteryx leptura TaxID=249018 RepID=UPI00339BDF98
MAWEATYLRPLVLLVLLASGSWEQREELLRRLEGETFSVTCWYSSWDRSKMKFWCRQTSAGTCNLLVTYPRGRAGSGTPRHFIQDYPSWDHFTVTVTELRLQDSGFYWCGIYEYPSPTVLKSIRLVVSRASTLPTTRSTRRTTAWTSATTSLPTDSPPGHWYIAAGVTTALLLLLVLAVLTTLYLCKARGRARTGEDKSHHIYDISAHEDKTVPRKDLSARQRESQLSWTGSGEDTGDIQYASLAHLNHFGSEDSIYVNTRPGPKPTPDPILAVEYASIMKNRPRPQVACPGGGVQDLRAEASLQ